MDPHSAATREESPTQKQARIRRERREAKIKAGGSSRLDKITSLSGRPAESGTSSSAFLSTYFRAFHGVCPQLTPLSLKHSPPALSPRRATIPRLPPPPTIPILTRSISPNSIPLMSARPTPADNHVLRMPPHSKEISVACFTAAGPTCKTACPDPQRTLFL